MLKAYQRAELAFQERNLLAAQGQNSRTFIAHDAQLDAEIVIKQIAKANLHAAEYFLEAKLLYSSSHPNVVQLYYACEDADHLYIAMPLYSKGSLKGLMAARHLTVREIITLGCQVLSGLHNVHSKRLIHLDIKPDNVLLSLRGEALLSDFGLAKQLNADGIAEQSRFYVRIRPPEAFQGAAMDSRADIYQFGLLLYRMCNGNAAFLSQFAPFVNGNVIDVAALRQAVVDGRFPDRSLFQPHIPERIRSVVRRCLQVDPTSRFPTAIEVANELAQVDGPILDWQFTEAAGSRRWTKHADGRFWEFEANSEQATTCHKTVRDGRRQRVGAGSSARMTDRQLRSFLGSH